MSTPDKQFVAIANTQYGYQLVDYRQPEGFTHRFLTEDEKGPAGIHLGDIYCPDGYQDALKLSGVSGLFVFAGQVKGGSEDVIDVNHCTVCNITIAEAFPQGKYIATIKGGSRNISLSVISQVGHGKEVDYDLGNWSDQSQEKTTGISLFAQGETATVRAINSDKPNLNSLCSWKYSGWLRGWFPIVQKLLKAIGLG